MKKQKFYAVWKGKKTGVFDSWEATKEAVHGVEAHYKSFDTKKEAENALKENYWKFVEKNQPKPSQNHLLSNSKPNLDAVVVDAAWNSVTKDMEYQGFYLKTKEKLFHRGPFPKATNNIGEFLAIVHALAFLKKQNSDLPIYSDSRTAISWVKNKKANTKLDTTEGNPEIFDLIERAEKWLKENPFLNKILKWETEFWGENPADFGRK